MAAVLFALISLILTVLHASEGHGVRWARAASKHTMQLMQRHAAHAMMYGKGKGDSRICLAGIGLRSAVAAGRDREGRS